MVLLNVISAAFYSVGALLFLVPDAPVRLGMTRVLTVNFGQVPRRHYSAVVDATAKEVGLVMADPGTNCDVLSTRSTKGAATSPKTSVS